MAVLATISFPGVKLVLMNAQMTRYGANIRSIGMGLRNLSTDKEGLFPAGEIFLGEKIASSNDAFRLLLPDYIDNEDIFAVSCSCAVQSRRSPRRADSAYTA